MSPNAFLAGGNFEVKPLHPSSRQKMTTVVYKPTFVEETIDSSESGVIVVRCVGVELQNEAALRRIKLVLCQSGSVTT